MNIFLIIVEFFTLYLLLNYIIYSSYLAIMTLHLLDSNVNIQRKKRFHTNHGLPLPQKFA